MDGNDKPPQQFGGNNWGFDSNQYPAHQEYPPDAFTNSQVQFIDSIIGTAQQDVFNQEPVDPSFDQTPSYGTFEELPDQVYLVPDPLQNTIHTSSSSSSINGVPAMDNWTGDLNFTAQFSQAQDKTKATPWIFSAKLEKLFVSLDKACPVNFFANIPPHLFCNYLVRGQIVYSRAEDFADAVERCINHQQSDSGGFPYPAHVLRCDEGSAVYEDRDNRHSVVVALKPPAGGMQCVTLCYRFMCRSSCIGTLNRRPTKLIFSLETISGQEVGRFAVDVRMCSCPGRDIKAEEEKMQPTTTAATIPIYLPVESMTKTKSKKRKPTAPVNAPVHTVNGNNTAIDDDDQIYTVQVRGRRNYEMVQDIVDRIMRRYNELMSNTSTQDQAPDQVKRFKQEEP